MSKIVGWSGFIDRARSGRLPGFGISVRQKATWTWLYAYHLKLFPGGWFWKMFSLVFPAAWSGYNLSIKNPSGFWFVAGKEKRNER